MNFVKHVRKLVLGGALRVFLGVSAHAQQPVPLTNSFPTNLFLTDGPGLFWYQKGERLIDIRRIEDARKSAESRPAEQDPEGHWGEPQLGYQLSLRFDKQAFSNEEPVMSTLLLRNVSDKTLTYSAPMDSTKPTPISISVWKDGVKLDLKTKQSGIFVGGPPREISLQPRTQHREQLLVDHFFDLSKAGTYFVEAECGTLASQKVSIVITNAP